MYKSSRQLIKDRQPFSRYELRKITVRRIGGGEYGMCCYNADKFKNIDINGTGSKQNFMVSGWIVGAFDKEKCLTEISQHWWNVDGITKEHFDTTPIDGDTTPSQYEYIIDEEIAVYGMEMLNVISSNVTKDLVLMNGQWFTHNGESDDDGMVKLDIISELSNEKLFIIK